MPQNILITGADGLLGTNITLKLVDLGFSVTAVLHPKTRSNTLDQLTVRKEYCDIVGDHNLMKIIRGQDIVIHAAANTDVWPARSQSIKNTNIIGTTNVINACIENRVHKLIHIGSGSSYSPGSKERPGDETSVFTGNKYNLDYIDSKYEAQKLVKEAFALEKIRGIIICPTFMIGPYDSKPSSGQIILALAKRKIPGYTPGGKNFVFVKDVADAVINGLTIGKNGEEYIAGNVNLTYREFFTVACKELNVPRPRYQIPKNIILTHAFINTTTAKIFNYKPSLSHEMALVGCDEQYLSSAKAQLELKMPNTPIEVAVREAFDWFKKENYI